MTTYVSIADTDPVGSCRNRICIEGLPIWVRFVSISSEFEAELPYRYLFLEYFKIEIKTNFGFPTAVKPGVGSGFGYGSASKWKVGSGSDGHHQDANPQQ